MCQMPRHATHTKEMMSAHFKRWPPILTERDKFISDPIVNAICYKPPARPGEQMGCYNAVKESDRIWKTDWCEDLSISDEYFAYDNKLDNRLAEFESIWDGHLGWQKAVQRRIDLEKMGSRPICAGPYCVRPKEGEIENQEIIRMVVMNLIKPAQSLRDGSTVFVPTMDRTLRFCVV